LLAYLTLHKTSRRLALNEKLCLSVILWCFSQHLCL